MNPLVSLAKAAVENFTKENKVISPAPDISEEFLKQKAGVFVTIENAGSLRGCIGTYLPSQENICKEVIQNAIAAAAEDYRFESIKKEELPFLSYAIYILGEPELVKDISELNPKKYGIIVKSQGFSSTDVIFNPAPSPYQKTGILLPNLEKIDTAEQQIDIACQKGGIDQILENIIIYRFEAKKYQ